MAVFGGHLFVLHFLLLILLLLLQACFGHERLSNVASFFIRPSEEQKIILHSSSHPNIQCEFTYSTANTPRNTISHKTAERVAAEKAAKNTPSIDAAKFDFAATIALLRQRSSCPTIHIDYWDYEVCLAGKVRQYHSTDEYILARDAKLDNEKHELLLSNGQSCPALGGIARSVRVKFACKPFGDELTLVSVTEPSTCAYEALIAHPDFCKDKSFERVAAQSASSIAHTAALSFEDWTMRLHHTYSTISAHSSQQTQNEAMIATSCEVFVSDFSLHSALYFHSAKLTIQSALPSSSLGAASSPLPAAVARERDRRLIDSNSFHLREEEAPRRVSFLLKESGEDAEDQFNGRLTFIKVYG